MVKKHNARIINFYHSVLHAYPGHGRVIPTWVIFNGEQWHGVIWHGANADIDAGIFFARKKSDVDANSLAMDMTTKTIMAGTERILREAA